MKITVVCDVLGKENNGTTIAAMNLIRYLKERGHQVRILCCDQDKAGQPDYFVVPTRSFGPFNGYVEKNGVSIAKPDRDIVKQALEGADIVHIMMPFSLGLCAASMAKEMNLPVSAGCHLLAENFTTHLFMQNFKPLNDATYIHFGKLYKKADSVHYVTPYMREVYESKFGQSNGYVISNGVLPDFTPSEAEPQCDKEIRIVYTGRYSREKSHKTLIAAVSKSKYAHRIQLILPGDGPLHEQLEKQGEELPIKPLFGFVDRNKMPDLLRSCYLYVHAAEIEAEGISCLEAISCGVVPIINNSPRCATKSYALEQNNMFEDNDSDDLAEKIDWWIEHRDEYLANRKKYIEMSANLFSRKKCMEQMEEMLIETATRFAPQNKIQSEQ